MVGIVRAQASSRLAPADNVTKRPEITVFGSGSASITQAFYALISGYQVHLISKDPDPTLVPTENVPGAEGSTFCGPGQRFITMFEGHPYLEFLEYVKSVYPDIGNDFMKSALKGGWLAKDFAQFSTETQEWLRARHDVNLALINDDPKFDEVRNRVRACFDAYTQENRDAMIGWFGLISYMLRRHPELVDKIGLQTYLLRLYDTKEAAEGAVAGHKKQNVLRAELTQAELTEKYRGVKASSMTEGGAIEKYGLALGIQPILTEIIEIIKRQGGTCEFNREAEEILVNADGQVEGVKMRDGAVERPSNMSFNTGSVDSSDIYRNIPGIRQQIVAMEGYWVYIKPEAAAKIDKNTREASVKIHGKQSIANLLDALPEARREYYLAKFAKIDGFDTSRAALESCVPIIDFNNRAVQDGQKQDMILMGSGYVLLGHPQRGKDGRATFTDSKEAREMTENLMRVWSEVLYGVELNDQDIKTDTPCRRSWSLDDNELFVNMVTANGGVCAIGGGGNTGGTTKSLFFAKVLSWVIDEFSSLAEKTQSGLEVLAERVRTSHHKTPDDAPVARWETLTSAIKRDQKEARLKADGFCSTLIKRSGTASGVERGLLNMLGRQLELPVSEAPPMARFK